MTAQEQLAEALLWSLNVQQGIDEDEASGIADELLTGLVPLVERIAKERAADEMRAVAHRLDDGGDEAIEVALGGARYVHQVLCDTAHALDGKP